MEDGQKQSDSRRAPAFTSETAREAGVKGGHASAQARRERKIIRELAEDILACRVKDHEILARLRDMGLVSKKGKATVGEAILGNMAGLAMKNDNDALVAAVTLIRVASGEIGTPPPTLRGFESEGVGGVVIMPPPDPTLTEHEDGAAEESEAEP